MTGSGSDDEADFGDVLNAFSLDSKRGTRRRGFGKKRLEEDVTPEAENPDVTDESPALPGDAEGNSSAHGTELEDPSTLVRPYTWTGGRTRSTVDLQLDLETLVSSRPGPDGAQPAQFEHRSIAALCHHPHSVAEVAAKLGVPLGVARVLLSDMAELGFLVVHKSVGSDDRAAHYNLMERVLSGLRRL